MNEPQAHQTGVKADVKDYVLYVAAYIKCFLKGKFRDKKPICGYPRLQVGVGISCKK